MMKADAIGLYVHIPFCLRKCNYCDFCSFDSLDGKIRAEYISALIREIKSYKREEKISVDTLFFGGGTPSLLEPHEFEAIVEAIRESFNLLSCFEFTIEVNPKTVTLGKLLFFKSQGVNRISIGLQSIHENEMKILGRIHNFDDFIDAYYAVKKVGISNVSIDVMYGIPEQTKESFLETLNNIIILEPTHISVYGLILEEGTRFWNLRDKLPLPSEDEECEMYFSACEYLRSKGYSHYEISNYSKPGFESKHNLKYWRCENYIGVGISAYSYFEGHRYGNTKNLSEYLSRSTTQYITDEVTDPDTHAFEYAMLAFRLAEGISLTEYKNIFGRDFLSSRVEKINKYIEYGYMNRCGDRLSLTESGFYVSNTILAELL